MSKVTTVFHETLTETCPLQGGWDTDLSYQWWHSTGHPCSTWLQRGGKVSQPINNSQHSNSHSSGKIVKSTSKKMQEYV